jgi:hypothetical protein
MTLMRQTIVGDEGKKTMHRRRFTLRGGAGQRPELDPAPVGQEVDVIEFDGIAQFRHPRMKADAAGVHVTGPARGERHHPPLARLASPAQNLEFKDLAVLDPGDDRTISTLLRAQISKPIGIVDYAPVCGSGVRHGQSKGEEERDESCFHQGENIVSSKLGMEESRLRIMKPAIVITAVFVCLHILAVQAGDKKVDVSKIHGRIQFVKSFPDYKVQAVTSFPDLRVEIVESFPNSAGKWQIVDSFPDYKIEMVNSFPDFTIEYVKSFPGPAK